MATGAPSPAPSSGLPTAVRYGLAGVAAAAHVAVFVVLYLPAGLVVPLWGIALLWVLWALLAGQWWIAVLGVVLTYANIQALRAEITLS